MYKNPGLKGRVGIEIGTALGNALGTMIILLIWTFFKEVAWLLALMITLAALVLFKMAEDSLDHADIGTPRIKFVHFFHRGLVKFNSVVEPFLSKIIPSHSIKPRASKSFMGLLLASFSVPFILIGNGIGALILRKLTISNIDRIKKYKFLKNGAMYSIFFLGVIMSLHAFHIEVPPYVSPIITFGTVGYFFFKSRNELRKMEKDLRKL
jgi:4-hydroxybenzoate polyprenyltransferase